MDSPYEAIEKRRRNLRLVFMGIIVMTLPFYCIGFALWATAPQQRPTDRVTLTITPIDQTIRPSNTSLPTSIISGTATARTTLGPTPGQFIPQPPRATVFLPPTGTFVIIPSSTTAPSLTPFPTFAPPTATPPPLLPTFTPIPPQPTNTPPPQQPTNTVPPPPPTETPFVLPPPSETPFVPPTETPTV
jgi:hypothetical protein